MYLRNFIAHAASGVVLTAMVAVLTACGPEKKMHLTDVEWQQSMVQANGSPVTGELWSDDDLTWCMTLEEGIPKAFRLYHDNGKEAFVMNSPADTLQAFDENGQVISIDSFAIAYKQLAQQIPELMGIIKASDQTPQNPQP